MNNNPSRENNVLYRLDIHKKDTRACVLNENGKFVHGERMNDHELSVVIEATGFYFWIYDVIVGGGHRVKVVHPTSKGTDEGQVKDGQERRPHARPAASAGGIVWNIRPLQGVRELRELTRHRESLVCKKGDLKREIVGALDRHGIMVPAEFKTRFSNKLDEHLRGLGVFIINEKLDLLDTTVEKLRSVETAIEEHYGKDDEVELMMMPGIGIVTASVLKGEIGDIARFRSLGNLATYAGMTPSRSQSGKKEWYGPTGHDNNRIKHVLIEMILSHVHHKNDTRIKDFYDRKKGPLGENKVIGATARKMLEAINFMLLRRETYRAH